MFFLPPLFCFGVTGTNMAKLHPLRWALMGERAAGVCPGSGTERPSRARRALGEEPCRHRMYSCLLGRPSEPCPLLTASSFIFPEGFTRRKKTSLWFVGSLLVVSVFILTIGLAATTRTENVTVGGYYPGIMVSAGALG